MAGAQCSEDVQLTRWCLSFVFNTGIFPRTTRSIASVSSSRNEKNDVPRRTFPAALLGVASVRRLCQRYEESHYRSNRKRRRFSGEATKLAHDSALSFELRALIAGMGAPVSVLPVLRRRCLFAGAVCDRRIELTEERYGVPFLSSSPPTPPPTGLRALLSKFRS